MADDDQTAPDEGVDPSDVYDDDAAAAVAAEKTSTASSIIEDAANFGEIDSAEDEPIPDFVAKLIVDDESDNVTVPSDIVNAAISEFDGHVTSSTTNIIDSINDYTATISQGIYNELIGNSTVIPGEKRWWAYWSWQKILVVLLIALCIIGIILGLLFFLLGKKNKKTPRTGSTNTAKAAVKKDILPDTKYQPVPKSAGPTVKGLVTKGISPDAGYQSVPTTTAGPSNTAKGLVTKGISPDVGHQHVPTTTTVPTTASSLVTRGISAEQHDQPIRNV